MPKQKPKPRRLVWRIKQKNPPPPPQQPPPPPPPPPPPMPSWVELPREITADILQRLGPVEILANAQRVCTTWWKVCRDPAMWRVINMNVDYDYFYDLQKVCRVAVDRSLGQLVKLTLHSFVDDDLLNYIAERSSQLKYLRLISCYEISAGGLAAAFKNFPLLEELQIYFSVISKVDIEAIGRSCPLLKSFTMNDIGFRGSGSADRKFSDQALAIAGNMPELRYLALFGNDLTNEGLCAILDGCPLLESLDLRHCYNIDLKGDLGRRCRQHITDLKCPFDSTSGYEFSAEIFDFDDEYLSEDDMGLPDYYYYDYDDFDYDDFTDPFSNDYFDEDGFLF